MLDDRRPPGHESRTQWARWCPNLDEDDLGNGPLPLIPIEKCSYVLQILDGRQDRPILQTNDTYNDISILQKQSKVGQLPRVYAHSLYLLAV
jgi:hypothetical protein